MAQFDIHENDDERTRGHTPYLLDLQADLLSELATRLVAPLRPKSSHEASILTRLHPIITVMGEEHILVVTELAAIPARIVGSPVGSAREYRKDVIAAIDLLITGF